MVSQGREISAVSVDEKKLSVEARVNSAQQAILDEAGFGSLSEMEVELKAEQGKLSTLKGRRRDACLKTMAELKDLLAQYEQVDHMHAAVFNRFDY